MTLVGFLMCLISLPNDLIVVRLLPEKYKQMVWESNVDRFEQHITPFIVCIACLFSWAQDDLHVACEILVDVSLTLLCCLISKLTSRTMRSSPETQRWILRKQRFPAWDGRIIAFCNDSCSRCLKWVRNLMVYRVKLRKAIGESVQLYGSAVDLIRKLYVETKNVQYVGYRIASIDWEFLFLSACVHWGVICSCIFTMRTWQKSERKTSVIRYQAYSFTFRAQHLLCLACLVFGFNPEKVDCEVRVDLRGDSCQSVL